MDDDFMKQVIAEVIESAGTALGLVAAALARRQNATQLTEDLRATIAAAKLTGTGSTAIRIATHALAAVEAESVIQNPPRH
jgi:hypothetical protein